MDYKFNLNIKLKLISTPRNIEIPKNLLGLYEKNSSYSTTHTNLHPFTKPIIISKVVSKLQKLPKKTNFQLNKQNKQKF